MPIATRCLSPRAPVTTPLGARIPLLCLLVLTPLVVAPLGAQPGTWEAVGPGDAVGASRISGLTFLPQLEPPTLLASGDGLWRSSNRGATWERLRDDSIFALTPVPSAPGRLYGLKTVDGLGVSDDGGETWRFPGQGCIASRFFAVAPSDPDTVLVGGPTITSGCGQVGEECELFVSRDGGRTFSCAKGDLPLGSGADVLFDPRDEGIAYLATGAGVLRTRDGGATWRPVLEGVAVEELAASPDDPAVVWAGTDGGEVWRSPDRGDTWLRTPFPTPEPLPEPGVPRLSIAPRDPDTVYAHLDGVDVFVTRDSGGTWSRISFPVPDEPPIPRLLSLTFDPLDPGTAYAVLEGFGVLVTRDAGEAWAAPGEGLPEEVTGALEVDPTDPRRLFAGTVSRGVFRLLQVDTSPCVPDGTTLCLNRGRFEVEVAWEDFEGQRGVGHAMPETGDSGWFWFFRPDNVELLVKVLDGRTINGRHWVFYGALSNVAYTITVRDTDSGQVKRYPNPFDRFASVGDTAAFPLAGDAAGIASGGPAADSGDGGAPPQALALPQTHPPTPCEPDAHTLCLQDGRFRVQAHWRDFQGGEGEGRAVPLVLEGSDGPTDDSGFFWFFRPDNLELVVKVIDGREVNGNFWFFYGALSNVEYRLEVLDVVTGRRAAFDNPSGRFASFGDTETFVSAGPCGTLLGLPCPEGQTCDLFPGTCNISDGGGTCRVVSEECPADFDPVCGCDGQTYANDCERLRAGVTLDHDGACAGEVCGTIAGIPCGEGEFCEFPVGSCRVADVGGRCSVRPEGCTLVFDPVCGCDGVTYSNDCFRQAEGITKAHDGACEGGSGGE